MEKIDNLINSCEKLYEKNKSSFMSFIMLQRFYLGFFIHNNKEYLNKAYHVAVTGYNENKANIDLFLFVTFLFIEIEEYYDAEQNLSDIDRYKKYFKNNEPIVYGTIIYLHSLLEARREKYRSSLKYFKTLENFNENVNIPYFDLYLGNLCLEMKNKNNMAGEYFCDAYDHGLRSMYFFISIYRYFTSTNLKPLYTEKLLMPLLKWGIAHSLNLKNIIELYKEKIKISILNYNIIGINLYELYPSEWILEQLCKAFMRDLNYSKKAFLFYKEASIKQIEINMLNDFLIKSAYRNEIEDLSIYPVKNFLEKNEIDFEIKPFIYHVILSDKKYTALADKYKLDIIQFSLYCLENNLKGRYYNSIYKFLLVNDNEFEINKDFINKAEKFLINQLFLYEIELDNLNVKNMWIKEKQKLNVQYYNVEDGKAVIKSVSDKFSYYLLDESKKSILGSNIKITKMTENVDFNLYVKFYNKGHISDELLICLSEYYLSYENPDYSCVSVFENILKHVKISKSFQMKILTALGNIYLFKKDYEKASKYYKQIDDHFINEKNIENILNVFISSGEIERAVEITIKRINYISDRTVYYVVKKASKYEHLYVLIADLAYDLLLKSWYDRKFIDIVLNYYKGSQEEWQKLSNVLDIMSVSDKSLNELIVKNGIWMHKFDKGIQEIFIRIYKREPDNELIDEFIEFCCFEVIVNSSKVERGVIDILEKRFMQKEERILTYTLAHIYVLQGISTFHSEYIIKRVLDYMEEDNIIFPIFKKCKDKSFNTPYIEKNSPFIYKTTPDKNVLLYYKEMNEESFNSKQMNYFKFGLYITVIPVFYNETIEYYISEQMSSGSIETKSMSLQNSNIFISENQTDDFFEINNALIYHKMFKYDDVEKIITEKLKSGNMIKGKLL